MKRHHLIALAVLVLVLLGLRMFFSRDKGTAVDLRQAGVHRVVTAEIDPSSVTWIEVAGPGSAQAPAPPTPPPPPDTTTGEATDAPADAAPDAPDASDAAPASAPDAVPAPAPLRLEKRNGEWVIASLSGAPADDDSVEKFVAQAVALAGESRGRGESSWTTFGVDPAHAIQVRLGVGTKAPGVTLHVGRQGDRPDSHFVRVEGSDEVVHVREGLRGSLGLWGAGPAAPAPDLWLRKEILDLQAADMARVAIDRPDMRVVLQRQEPPMPAPAKAPPPADATDATTDAAPADATTGGAPDAAPGAATDATADATTDAAVEPVEIPPAGWTVVEPAFSWPVKPALDATLDRLGQARVAGVLDADSPACLAAPAATLTITRIDGTDVILLVRGKVEGEDEVALTLDGQSHCWSMSTWGLGTILPKASVLWEAPPLAQEPGPDVQMNRLRIERPGQTLVASRMGDEWTVAGSDMAGTRAASIATSIRYLRLEDLAREAQAVMTPHATVTLDIGGRPRTIRLLGERPGGVGERYARLDGAPVPPGHVLVFGKATVDSILP